MKTKLYAQVLRSVAYLFALTAFSWVGNAQTRHDVTVSDYEFSPSQLEVMSGDTVVWTNTEGEHNVNGTTGTYPSNPESFGNDVGSGWTYTFVFTMPGTYDYHCDPHVGMGMTGQVVVSAPPVLTMAFTNMTPHVGQMLYLNLVDKATNMEVTRTSTEVTENFDLEIEGIEVGKSYQINFYADHSGNGRYDAPPTDHAWRLDLDNVEGDTTVTFVHNTSFTDIEWKNKLTVNFTGMTPHVGQLLVLVLYDTVAMAYVDTVTVVPVTTADFVVESFEIVPGNSYNVDFFADLNMNFAYDPPPTDHAWRLTLYDVQGDTTLDFQHNTNFTDIMPLPTRLGPGKELKTVSLYPNPSSDFVTLSGDELPVGEIRLKILNGSGQVVKSLRLVRSADPLMVNINDLAKGTYYLLIEEEGFKGYSKFIKSE